MAARKQLVREQATEAALEAELESRRAELERLLDELEASDERAHAPLDAALAAVAATRGQLDEPGRADGAG